MALCGGTPVGGAAQPDSTGTPITVLGHLVLPADIGGRPALLVFDPIDGVILDQRWARANGVPIVDGAAAGHGGRVQVGGAGGERREAWFARDLDVVVGGVATAATRVVLPLDSLLREAIGHRVDGLVGLSAFPDAVVGVSPGRGLLQITPRSRFAPPHGARELPVRYDRGVRPILTLGLLLPDGRSISATTYFDFGMSGNLRFTTAFADRIGIVAAYCSRRLPTAADSSEVGLGGALSSLRIRVPAVTLAGASLATDLVATVARERVGADASPAWDVLVGWGLMRGADWWFDAGGGRLWVRPQPGTLPPRGSAEAGVAFQPIDGTPSEPLVVAAVEPGSAAAAAGLRTGDSIQVVAGGPVSGVDAERVETMLSRRAAAVVDLVVRGGGGVRAVSIRPRESLRPAGGC